MTKLTIMFAKQKFHKKILETCGNKCNNWLQLPMEPSGDGLRCPTQDVLHFTPLGPKYTAVKGDK